MIFFFLQAFFMPVAIGTLVVHRFWCIRDSFWSDIFIKLSLGIGVGLGISSICFFIWVHLLGCQRGFFFSALAESVLLGMLVLGTLRRTALRGAGQKDCSQLSRGVAGKSPLFFKVLVAVISAVSVANLLSFVAMALNWPHGQWDAIAIWNLHAKFLSRGDMDWVNFFSHSHALAHGDYPWLLPGFIARSWKFLGGESVIVPVVTGFLFMTGTVCVLVATITKIKGRVDGLLAGLFLLGASPLVEGAVSQYADIGMSFFFCSVLGLFVIVDQDYLRKQRLLVITGLMMGFAAWTKNEGLLFVVSVLAARLIRFAIEGGWKSYVRELKFLGVGLFPVLCLRAYFECFLVPPHYFLPGGNIMEKITDLSRYQVIVVVAHDRIMHVFGHVGLVLLPYLILAGIYVRRERACMVLPVFLTLAFMSCGYFFVYLTTPLDLVWHLSTSCKRLFFQLWPSIILFVFLLTVPVERMQQHLIESCQE